jgi:hypothetical protein
MHPVDFLKSPQTVVEAVQAISSHAPDPFDACIGERLGQQVGDSHLRHEMSLRI